MGDSSDDEFVLAFRDMEQDFAFGHNEGNVPLLPFDPYATNKRRFGLEREILAASSDDEVFELDSKRRKRPFRSSEVSYNSSRSGISNTMHRKAISVDRSNTPTGYLSPTTSPTPSLQPLVDHPTTSSTKSSALPHHSTTTDPRRSRSTVSSPLCCSSIDPPSPLRRRHSSGPSVSKTIPPSRDTTSCPTPKSGDCSPVEHQMTSYHPTFSSGISHPADKVDTNWLSDFTRLSSDRRLFLLTALIRKCSHSELIHLQSALQPHLKRDFISHLPPEIGLQILTYLSPRDLISCAKVSRHWQRMCEDDLLWRQKCEEVGIDATEDTRDSSRTPQCTTVADSPCSSPTSASGPLPSSPTGSQSWREEGVWKRAFFHRHQMRCNWRRGTSRPPRVLKGHENHVITCLEFYQDKVMSASDDSTIRVWHLPTGVCLHTLYGHIGGVWCCVMVGHLFISGSTDRSVRLWDVNEGVCVNSLFGHASTVRCLASGGSREGIVVSGSRDTTLRVWEIYSGRCLHLLQGHRAAVRCVEYKDDRIVSGSYDSNVRVWSASTGECIHVLSHHLNRVYTLAFDGRWIVSGSLDTTIIVWDANTGQMAHTLFGHESLTSGIELQGHYLVSSNADATVRVWNILTGQCTHVLAGVHKHRSAVTCVQVIRIVDDDLIISTSDDGTAKLWDLATGRYLRTLLELDSGGSGGVVWRVLASKSTLVCAAGSRNGVEETKLVVIEMDDPIGQPHVCSRTPN